MRVPLVYSAVEIKQWNTDGEMKDGRWVPSRPCGFNYWSWEWVKYRLRIVWNVWIGKYDVLNWKGDTQR